METAHSGPRLNSLSAMPTINIASQFSRYPAGRFVSDGPFSGEYFRDNLLIPALDGGEKVILQMDGTRGYGSSFLEEAFGGLVRKGYKPEALMKRLEFQTSDPSITEEIISYIEHGAAPG